MSCVSPLSGTMPATDFGLVQRPSSLMAKTSRLSWVKLKLFIHKESSFLNYEPPQDLAPNKFISHCRLLLSNSCDNLRREFQLLNSLSVERAQPTHVAVQTCNRAKNRYINVLPYDTTRVHLHRESTSDSDYINASFVKGFSGDHEYIAAQGPKPDTVADFWSMILQHRVAKIVMLCSFLEKGRVKCEKYFPDHVNEYFVYNNIRVGCTSQSVETHYTCTHLRITRDSEVLEVKHYHLRDWQDFGIPGGPDVLVNFCNLVRNDTPSSQLTVVHCSAGVGRTGTYIACDILLQCLNDNRKLNIFRTVLDLREQRAHMVQSEAQYVYLYQSLTNAVESSDVVKLRSGDTTPTTPTKDDAALFQLRTAELNNNSSCSNSNTTPTTPTNSNPSCSLNYLPSPTRVTTTTNCPASPTTPTNCSSSSSHNYPTAPSHNSRSSFNTATPSVTSFPAEPMVTS
uniref:protein-tyrosine-phosphatase n=1 Tax=Cacopsylla melanoneura TaxID=428564 RepID=A0A8D9ETX6_9HEMI